MSPTRTTASEEVKAMQKAAKAARRRRQVLERQQTRHSNLSSVARWLQLRGDDSAHGEAARNIVANLATNHLADVAAGRRSAVKHSRTKRARLGGPGEHEDKLQAKGALLAATKATPRSSLEQETERLVYSNFADVYTQVDQEGAGQAAGRKEASRQVTGRGGLATDVVWAHSHLEHATPGDTPADDDGPVASPTMWAKGVRYRNVRSRQGRYARWSRLRARQLLRTHAEVQFVHETARAPALTGHTLETHVFGADNNARFGQLAAACKEETSAFWNADKARVDAYNKAYRAAIVAQRKKARLAASQSKMVGTIPGEQEAENKQEENNKTGKGADDEPSSEDEEAPGAFTAEDNDPFPELSVLEKSVLNCHRAKGPNAKLDELRKVFPRDISKYLRPEVYMMDDAWVKNGSIKNFGYFDTPERRKDAMQRIFSSFSAVKKKQGLTLKGSVQRVQALRHVGMARLGQKVQSKKKRSVVTMYNQQREREGKAEDLRPAAGGGEARRGGSKKTGLESPPSTARSSKRSGVNSR